MFCTIDFDARNRLGISNNKYILCIIIYHLSHNPSSKHPGWCYASQITLGQYVGISDKSIRTLLKSIAEEGLIERVGKHYRTTPKFYDIAIVKPEESSAFNDAKAEESSEKPEESSGSKGKKVPVEPEESSAYNIDTTTDSNRKKKTLLTDSQKCDWLIDEINQLFGRKFKHKNETATKKLKARMKEGFTALDFQAALDNIKNSDFGRENNFAFITPTYITSHAKLEYWMNVQNEEVTQVKSADAKVHEEQ
ncbi:hypothetical protein LCGC14_0501100 [marine sediment metagenome]|uniref:Uncharacterized protein n=1 Tax=marine sediment metagenome TaxID=412755 RepID=A0A0F9S3V6_9ZZZZ